MRHTKRLLASTAASAIAMAALAGSANAIEVTLGDAGTLADTLFLNVGADDIANVFATSQGAGPQFGTFTNDSGTYGLPNQGIVLSSGNVLDYGDGPNDQSDRSTDFESTASNDQEALLDGITGGAFDHRDVAQLTISFDAGVDVTSVTFFGTFGSEEFPEFVGSDFIDGFGLFVNGQNVAFANGDPINNDHPDMVGAFNDNGGDFPEGEGPPVLSLTELEPGDPRLARVVGTQLDGVLAPDLNPVLRFDVPVVAGETNTFDIIIGDTSDGILDSVIYLSSFQPTEFDLNDGSSEFTPLLPNDPDPNDNIFVFTLPGDLDIGEIFFIDPPVAVGYIYTVVDAEFQSIQMPSLAAVPDLDGYTVEIGGLFFDLAPGEFLDVSGLFATTFTLTGIDPLLLVDPLDFLAFPIGVSLQNPLPGGTLTITQQPITEAVPLPGALPLYLGGILAFAAARRYRFI